METGNLPSPSIGLRAAVVDDIMYVTSGTGDPASEGLTSILSWEPSSETWRRAGDLAVANSLHAAVVVSSSDIEESECLAMLLKAIISIQTPT